MSVRTEPRFTRDIDLVIAVRDDAAAEAYVHGLRSAGYEPGLIVEQERTGRMSTVRLKRSGRGPLVDLLFASSGIESEIVGAAQRVEVVKGLVVPVARIGHLIALKLLARDDVTRPQDALDLRALSAAATAEEWELAHLAVSMIEAREFHRGRDLLTALTTLRGPA